MQGRELWQPAVGQPSEGGLVPSPGLGPGSGCPIPHLSGPPSTADRQHGPGVQRNISQRAKIFFKIGKFGCWGDKKEAKTFGSCDSVLINNVMLGTTVIEHLACQAPC